MRRYGGRFSRIIKYARDSTNVIWKSRFLGLRHFSGAGKCLTRMASECLLSNVIGAWAKSRRRLDARNIVNAPLWGEVFARYKASRGFDECHMQVKILGAL